MERLNFLREKALNPAICSEKFYYLFYKYYTQAAGDEYQSYTTAFCKAFSELPPDISEGELIVGKCTIPLSESELLEWENKYRQIGEARVQKAGGGQDSHMAIDYELLLSKGINGIIAEIDAWLCACDEEKIPFYNACKASLQAVVRHSQRYADLALELSRQTQDKKHKAELEKICEICKKVPACPAESFYEAVQSVNFISHCLTLNPFRMCSQQFQLGRPDRYLLAYYEKDIANKKITKQEAQLLLDCLGIQINMRVPNGLSCGYMVGGRDKEGNIVANDITEMCMQVIDDIRLVYPAVGFCYANGMPEKYLKKACELLSSGYSHPAVFNDEVITKGLIGYGVGGEQACRYVHSTCVEITPIAASNVWVASPYTNMPQILLDIMDSEYSDFDELLSRYFAVLDDRIATNFEAQQQFRATRAENSINPLLSCFVNDCLKRGLDIEKGGAIYNWIMPSFVGMANLVDSLYAIKKLVFDEKRLSVLEFKKILDSNFLGSESLQLYIQNRIDKYGNDIDEIDEYFSVIAGHIASECKKYSSMHSNGNLIPSVFCWVMHEYFGRQTAATPDGRNAGFPLGDGSGPCQGREMNGPTASILSSTKWDHSEFIGGVAVNLKFSKSALGKKSLDALQSLIKTFLLRGGFEVQINVVDNETLKKAQRCPDDYKDLVVRIGGYSDYFVRLSPEMQQELILRTEHNV